MLEKWGVLEFLGIEDPDIYTIVALYAVLFIPAYLAVRIVLFLILPRTWLKWLFRI